MRPSASIPYASPRSADSRVLRPCAARAIAVVLASIVALTIAGCGGASGDQLGDALSAYEGGEYQQSLTLASQANEDARTTKDSLESAYIAGMSAFRLGRHEEAVGWLEAPARSDDRWMAGQASVTLGSSLLELRRTNEAARSFVRAAERLDGEEARKARLAAANAYRELGDRRASDEQFRLANVTPPSSGGASSGSGSGSGSGGTSGRPAASGSPASDVGPFVLQAGAFKDRSKADKRAAEIRAAATRAGLGEPKILSKTGPDGGTLHVVQFGRFPDRRSADASLGRLGVTGVVVGRPAT
jgi:tetratricopeptide (TPR) repeat protein